MNRLNVNFIFDWYIMLNIINSFIEISGSESNLIRKIRYKRENDASFLILRLLFEKSRE